LEEPAPTKELRGIAVAGDDAVGGMLLQGDVFSLDLPPIRFVLFRWNIRWDPKGHLEAPARHAGGEEKRVSERIKVRGGAGKPYEPAVDELDLDISPRSDPGVGPRQTDSGMNAATSFWSVGRL
jgi:hypothetical protein